jgi:hypothetical protein
MMLDAFGYYAVCFLERSPQWLRDVVWWLFVWTVET